MCFRNNPDDVKSWKEFQHPLAGEKTGSDCIVDFDGSDDPYQPRNWSRSKKVVTTAVYGLITMTATWTTSMYF